jgi:RNA recognition motif-containing protein
VLKECVDLIVLGIPYSTTADELAQYFEQFGAVATVEVRAYSFQIPIPFLVF